MGGTWHFNTYPGCGCDVPSHLYSFSFAPNPDWTRTYSRQPEIRDYLQRTADEFGVRPHVRTNTAVESAAWDEEAGRWIVQTDAGTFSARMLVPGMGPLAEPRIPDIEGLEDFEGDVMHSARWDHSVDLKGKRVASIGTGASAIQYVPAIQPDVEQLHVFQRTPPWIMPHTDRPTTAWERRLYGAFPALEKVIRGGVYAARELLVLGFVKQPEADGPGREDRAQAHRAVRARPRAAREGHARLHDRLQADPALEPVVPRAGRGQRGAGHRGRRARPPPTGVVDAAGVEREVDAIIFGTGFHVTDMPVGSAVTGRGGKTLDEVWQGSPSAYLGTSIPGFPNLFMLLGPNTGLGHSSMIYMIESQIEHVIDALAEMRRHDADTVEVREDAARAFNAEIDKRHEGAVWNTGCASWYLDDTGRNATLWPDWTFRFRQRTASFEPDKYELTTKPSPARETVAA